MSRRCSGRDVRACGAVTTEIAHAEERERRRVAAGGDRRRGVATVGRSIEPSRLGRARDCGDEVDSRETARDTGDGARARRRGRTAEERRGGWLVAGGSAIKGRGKAQSAGKGSTSASTRRRRHDEVRSGVGGEDRWPVVNGADSSSRSKIWPEREQSGSGSSIGGVLERRESTDSSGDEVGGGRRAREAVQLREKLGQARRELNRLVQGKSRPAVASRGQ